MIEAKGSLLLDDGITPRLSSDECDPGHRETGWARLESAECEKT